MAERAGHRPFVPARDARLCCRRHIDLGRVAAALCPGTSC